MKHAFIFLSLPLLISCGSSASKQSTEAAITLENTQIIQTKSLEIINVISLETNADNLMGNRLRIRKYRNRLYVMDEEGKRKCLHIFDQSGSYVGKAIGEGEGPENIPSLDDFYVGSDGKLEFLSTEGDKTTIYQLTSTGSPEIKFKINYVATSFTKLPSDEYLLYGGYNLPIIKNRVIKVSAKGEIINRYLPNEYAGKLLPMTERNFFRSGNKINFIESFNHQAYQYKEDSLAPIYTIDFGQHSIPSSYWEMDYMESFPMLNEKGFGNLTGIFQGNQNTLIECMLQGPYGVNKQLLFFKEANKPVLSIKIDEEELPVFYYPIGVDDGDDHFLFLTYHHSLRNYLTKTKQSLNFPRTESDFDFPVIISVKLVP